MLQADRNFLFNVSYALDNHTRLWIPTLPTFRELTSNELERYRMQDKTKSMYILFTEDELAKVAESLRECAACDERRMLR